VHTREQALGVSLEERFSGAQERSNRLVYTGSCVQEETMNGRKLVTSLCCALGIVGAIACTVGMFAIPLGLAGAGIAAIANADSMQNMSGMSTTGTASSTGSHLPAWIAIVNRFGPEILLGSVVLMIAGLAIRRSLFGALIALLGGIVLYYGMYGTTNITIMWPVTGAGMILLFIALIGLRRKHPAKAAAG